MELIVFRLSELLGLARWEARAAAIGYIHIPLPRQRDIRDMLVGPNGRDVGETGEMGTG